ncbi:MAG TPA: HD domain-containing protein [Clostridiaceae bacterium]|nr:HD domain-containing protein [Clostridiaceae bacterium]
MTRYEMTNKLRSAISKKRFIHSINVMNCAVELAKRYEVDTEKAAIAGLLHDCAKNIEGDEALRLCEKFNIELDNVTRYQPSLLHGPLGSKIAEIEYGISDREILSAIYYHTTGCENMSLLEKIIYIADYIEPGRRFPGVEEVRKTVFENIDAAIIMSLDRTIKHVLLRGGLLHPNTVNARNYMIIEKLAQNQESG